MNDQHDRIKRLEENNMCLIELSTLLIRDFDMVAVLQNQGINSYNIWGMGYIGKLFYEYMKKNDFTPKDIIDIKTGIVIDGKEVKQPDDVEFDVDAVFVTIPNSYSSIREYINKKSKAEVILLKDLFEEFLLTPNMSVR